MASYWNNEGPHQKEYSELFSKLVPDRGATGTFEGELLRAASKVAYEAYNNGFINNISGPLIFLQDNLKGFKEEWSDILNPLATGNGTPCRGDRDREYETVEAIVDAAVVQILAADGNYTPFDGDMFDFQVQTNGYEPELPEEDEYDYYDEEDEDDEDWSPRY